METRRYFGARVSQRVDENTIRFFVFQARSKDVKQWAGVKLVLTKEGKVPNSPQGTQRVLRETRVRAIRRFLQASSVNTIPLSILVSFEPDIAQFSSLTEQIAECVPREVIFNDCQGQLEWGILTFSFSKIRANQPHHLRPALLIDGQHRLYGMSELDDEDIPILVVSLIDAPTCEQAFQYIVINNKTLKVPSVDVNAIMADLDEKDEEKLMNRLLKAGVNYGQISHVLLDLSKLPSSPFHKLLDWPNNKEGIRLVSLTAIEQSLRYLRATFTFLEDDDDSLVQIFMAIWRVVRTCYPEVWGQENLFMKEVNINALNEFIVSSLKYAWLRGLLDIFRISEVEREVLRIIESIPVDFWLSKWNIKVTDNSNVRRLIKSDLELIRQNVKLGERWHDDLRIAVVNY